jgi:hypothetical protein
VFPYHIEDRFKAEFFAGPPPLQIVRKYYLALPIRNAIGSVPDCAFTDAPPRQ